MASPQENMVAAVLAGLGSTVSGDGAAQVVADNKPCKEVSLCADTIHQAPRDPVNQTKKEVTSISEFPVEPRVVQFVKISKSRQDHSYRDFSSVPPPAAYKRPADIAAMSFSEKLHDIISDPANSKTLRWMPHGRAFHVDVPKNMEKHGILMKYYNHGRYSSFLRQLNNHGFKHLTVGQDRNCYYHECFLRGLPHLCRYMPPSKDARRLIPDPDNEPNFYAISQAYPLPDDAAHKPEPIVLPNSSKASFEQRFNTDASMPPPTTVPSYNVSSMSAVPPLASMLCNGNQGPTTFQASASMQPSNAPQDASTSANSFVSAEIRQGTLSFPRTAPQQPGDNMTLNLLEALLVRRSQVTQNHVVENPSMGRAAKMPRLEPPQTNLVTAPPMNNPTDRRIQDVAQSLATLQSLRSTDAQRLEAERQNTASANAVVAQAALLAAILNGNVNTGCFGGGGGGNL